MQPWNPKIGSRPIRTGVGLVMLEGDVVMITKQIIGPHCEAVRSIASSCGFIHEAVVYTSSECTLFHRVYV